MYPEYRIVRNEKDNFWTVETRSEDGWLPMDDFEWRREAEHFVIEARKTDGNPRHGHIPTVW